MAIRLKIFFLIGCCCTKAVFTFSSKDEILSIPNLSRREVNKIGFVGVLSALAPPSLALSDISAFSDGPRGIKFLITKEGNGEKPLRAQQVYTRYSLWIEGFPEDNGKPIDSNVGFLRRPFPVVVGVGSVIKGWDLTLLDMKQGESRRLIIPPEMGYGSRGAGGRIPPDATLFFEVELLGMDAMPVLNDWQLKWLDEHPI